uniref:Uncharacterized protein n=1 Tax=Cacopsylla melanoneura TaxID=428564 RepID=A0A8D8ZSC6_9HEMI
MNVGLASVHYQEHKFLVINVSNASKILWKFTVLLPSARLFILKNSPRSSYRKWIPKFIEIFRKKRKLENVFGKFSFWKKNLNIKEMKFYRSLETSKFPLTSIPYKMGTFACLQFSEKCCFISLHS